MPSVEHELLISLLRGAPSALRGLLAHALGVELGPLVEVSETFSDLSPAVYTVDLAVESDTERVLVEVQRSIDASKHLAWPLYAASAHARDGRPTRLVVLATDRRVAAWARRPIASFHEGCFAPRVIGPDELPLVDDEEAARAAPEFTVLAALVRGREGVSAEVAKAALAAGLELARRDESRGTLVLDALLDGLGPVARQMWEGTMRIENYEFKSEVFREYLAKSRAEGVALGREEGVALGREEGVALGREEGVALGREEGRDEGARAALRGTVRALAEGLGLGWSGAREAEVAALDAPRLQALVESVARQRRWPE